MHAGSATARVTAVASCASIAGGSRVPRVAAVACTTRITNITGASTASAVAVAAARVWVAQVVDARYPTADILKLKGENSCAKRDPVRVSAGWVTKRVEVECVRRQLVIAPERVSVGRGRGGL